MKIDVSMLSNPGGRKVNEDYTDYNILDEFGCYIMADGLGGHRGGDIASKAVAKSIISSFNASPGFSTEKLQEYMRNAALALEQLRSAERKESSLKTTLVVLLTGEDKACWAHVGDSRLYLFRSGRLAFQTRDHSVPQHLADSGSITADEIRFHEDRNRLTASFDSSNFNKIRYSDKPVRLEEGDRFLLCSDGFWEYVIESEMEDSLAQSRTTQKWLEIMEGKVISKAEEGHDNYSALALIVS
jgi:serine/threonine protein phosphatase PrpC